MNKKQYFSHNLRFDSGQVHIINWKRVNPGWLQFFFLNDQNNIMLIKKKQLKYQVLSRANQIIS